MNKRISNEIPEDRPRLAGLVLRPAGPTSLTRRPEITPGGLPGLFLSLLLFCSVVLFVAACSKPAADDDRKVAFYQSPMHPWITSDKPGNCTICGMQLVPVYGGEAGKAAADGVIKLEHDSVSVLNVATAPVRKLELTKTLRFSGILEDDENLHRVIAAYYDGRIDQVLVNHVGQYMEKGQPLAAIYSPELLYIVREYQNAMRGRNEAVARNSAQRLVQYGLSPEQVAGLARQSGEVFTIDLLAPISGTVLTKKAYKGQYIKNGEMLFEMGELARLWFHAEVYERDLADIRLGQKAILRSPTVPGRDFEGVVTFIDPNFDPNTRSTKVRIEVDNPPAPDDSKGLRRLLPHRAYAEAEILADLGTRLVVPRSAVLQDGRRSVVYVENAAGQYAQRTVKTGRVGDEGMEVLDNLKEGDRVVTQGNLMIDAEAQLRGGAQLHAESGPPVAAVLPASPEITAFLDQLALVTDSLAGDDLVAAIKAGQTLPILAAAIPAAGLASVDESLAKLKALRGNPGGSDLKAVRKSFLPWSMAGAELTLALAHGGQRVNVGVYECPMTGDSFPGAPAKARWVQSGKDVRNPYLGSEMLNCGAEVKP